MTPIETLVAIEQIKALKARYFRYVDTKNWEEFGRVFAREGVLEVRSESAETPSRKAVGAEAIVDWVSDVFATAVSLHHGHTPEIECLSADGARGIWAMDDVIIWPDRRLHGWGHYHETYVREDGEWKIAHTVLTRLRTEVHSAS